MLRLLDVSDLVLALGELIPLSVLGPVEVPSPFLFLILDLSVLLLGAELTVPVSVPWNLGDAFLPFFEVVLDPFFLDP